MKPVPPRIVLFMADTSQAELLRPVLEEEGYEVSLQLFDCEPANEPPPRLLLVDGTLGSDAALKVCQRERGRQSDTYVPILYIGAASPQVRLESLEVGADAFLIRPFAPAELQAQVRALLRVKEQHELLAARSAEIHHVHKKLQTAYQQIDMELEIARRLQESFLPQSLPDLPKARIAVAYRPCNRVGGDFYDAFRLDEHHLGFYVADAMGHGVPASLLTVFIKQGVKAKEINGKEYRLIPPNEVLKKLNRDLLALTLSENPFITMVYALFDTRDGTFRFSRAGHPYPLYIPSKGPLRLWQVEGSLLGVFETEYRSQAHTIGPGDRILLYTDGMDSAGFKHYPLGVTSLLAAAEHFRDLPLSDLIETLAGALFERSERNDDLTLLGVEYLSEANESR